MRARVVAVAVVSAALFVVADAALLDVLANRGVPSAGLCTNEWNRSTNAGYRAMAAEGHFDVAVVSGSLAKERYPGCGVLFRHGDGRPWLLFAGWLHAGRVDRWDLVTGERWGFDSPEGGPDAPNAVVSADGRVRLIET